MLDKVDNIRVHCLIAHYNEDLEWIKNIKYPYTIISKYWFLKEISPNKGIEISQYYDKKENILQLSKETYIESHNFLQETKILSWLTSRAFEYTWHYIFT